MKIKVTAKDAAIFGGFCIILLYLCDVCVYNIMQLAWGESEGFTIMPFSCFMGGPSYIGMMLFVFVGVLIAVFASLSSSIFNREK
jgi:hypothetical protein